jgi:hypothetical protein
VSRQTERHVAAGWDEEHELRWIEAGRLRLEEEDKDGAVVTIRDHVGASGAWLSSAELAGLTRELAGWFAEDPSDALGEIEAAAKRVRSELEAWNDRARLDEEHPPYDDLTRALDVVLARCKSLREDIGKFADEGAR